MAVAAGNVLYKWKDKDGNIKFGDRPPKDVPYERIKVRNADSGGSSTSAITEKLKQKEEDDENKDVKKQLSKMQEEMKAACKAAKANMQTLNNAKLIKIPAEEGGTRLMTDEERAAKKEETQRQIETYCDGESSE